MANVWMHNGFLQVEGEKMSKSLGNFVTINELLTTENFGGRTWPGQVLRLAMLRTHYRQPIDWTVRSLTEAEATLDDWAALVKGVQPGVVSDAFIAAMADDLNTSLALTELHRLARAGEVQTLAACLPLLGLDLDAYQPQVQQRTAELDKELIDARVRERVQARKNKDWKRSDEIRDELVAMGVQLKDGKDAAGELITEWEVKR